MVRAEVHDAQGQAQGAGFALKKRHFSAITGNYVIYISIFKAQLERGGKKSLTHDCKD